jgi:hypothetical protein
VGRALEVKEDSAQHDAYTLAIAGGADGLGFAFAMWQSSTVVGLYVLQQGKGLFAGWEKVGKLGED